VPELKRLNATRIVANAESLDEVAWPEEALVLRFAPDEALVIPPMGSVPISDPHAIIIADQGFAGVWVESDEAMRFLAHACEWELPVERPSLAQGSVAGVATKMWLAEDKVLFVVQAPYAAEFSERMGE
jgi:hypothetical protein